MTIDEQLDAIRRGTLEIADEDALRAKLERAQRLGKPLRVKLGLDPTAPYVHLGHAVVLRKMRQLQDFGHEVHIIIGDFTAAIGDPSGRSMPRAELSPDEIRANAKAYSDQYSLILDPAKTHVAFNSEWFAKMGFADVLAIVSRVTVARVLEREDLAERLQGALPLRLHELLYPVCQAYDSVVLEADLELGGTDQFFNIRMGQHLQSRFGQDPQVALLMPILPGVDGVKKMSKSLGNHIGITDPPATIYRKILSLGVEAIPTYYSLCTDVPAEEVAALKAEMRAGRGNPEAAKRRLAREIISLYHSPEAAEDVEASV